MAYKKLSTIAVIAIALTGIILTLSTSALVSTIQSIPASGTITSINVGVFSDSACTQTATSIPWGTLNPGTSQTCTIYVKNTGNAPETVSLSTTSWNPSNANTYLTLTWNVPTSTVINAGQNLQASLTLTTASNVGGLTSFSFNIIITGTSTS
jgi:hypothetical protein